MRKTRYIKRRKPVRKLSFTRKQRGGVRFWEKFTKKNKKPETTPPVPAEKNLNKILNEQENEEK